MIGADLRQGLQEALLVTNDNYSEYIDSCLQSWGNDEVWHQFLFSVVDQHGQKVIKPKIIIVDEAGREVSGLVTRIHYYRRAVGEVSLHVNVSLLWNMLVAGGDLYLKFGARPVYGHGEKLVGYSSLRRGIGLSLRRIFMRRGAWLRQPMTLKFRVGLYRHIARSAVGLRSYSIDNVESVIT